MQLRIQHGDGREEFVKLDKAKPLRIGSDPTADIVLEGRAILAVHVGVAFRDGSFVAMASKAAQTIDVNGQPVNQASLEEGDRVKLGPATITAVSDSAGKAASFEDEFGLAGDEAPKSAPKAAAKAPLAPKPVEEEFGLALEEDDHPKKPAAKEKPAEKPAEKAAPKLRSAEEKLHKVAAGPKPVDEEFGLAPDEDAKPASKPTKGAAKPAAKAPVDDDFGLSPVDDELPATPAGKPAAKPAAPASKPAAKKPEPEPEDDLGEIGLSPVEDEGHGKPAKSKSPKAAPGKAAPGKPAPGKPAAKAEPAKAPAPAKGAKPAADAKKGKPAPADDTGLEPLGDDSGLDPLGDDSGLEALDDGGLGDALGPAKELPAKSGGKAAAKAPAKGRRGKSGPSFGTKIAAALSTPGARKAGLSLGALAAIGLVAFVVTNLPTADAAFQTADQEFQAKQYKQASESFEKFLVAYPGDPRVGEARAKKGLSQLIPTLEAGSDWPVTLTAAEQALGALGPDARHESARQHLAAGLPKIAQALAERAATAFSRKQEGAPAMFEEAQRALVLVQKHVSSADRREQGVPAVEVKMFRLERELQLAQSLAKALAEIKTAAEAKKLTEAYALRTKLLSDYPRLASHGDLDQTMRLVADAATAAVERKPLGKAAVGADAPGPLALSMAIATAIGGKITVPAGALPAVVSSPGEGTVYGVDLAKGTVVWRRFVGFSPQVAPVPLGEGRVLIVDTARGELAALEQATGKVVWRNTLEGIAAQPAIMKGQAYVPTTRGAVVQVDLKTGALVGETLLPQPIMAPPAVDDAAGRVYQLGDHSNLYALSADGKCETAFATGHEPGTVRLAPILLGNVVVLAVDEDLDATTLRVFQRTRDFKLLQTIKLAGHVSRPPVATDKALYLASDAGQVLRCELDPAKPDQPLAVLSPVPGLPAGRPPEIALVGRELWVAGAGLSIYGLPISDAPPKRFFPRDRLVDAPRLLVAGKPGPMVLVRRVADWPGLAVSLAATAEDLAEARPEIRLAAIAGPARAEGKGEKLALVHPAGVVEEVPSSVLSAAEPPALGAQAPSVSRALSGDTIAWDDGHAVFVPATGFRTILVQDLMTSKTRRIDLPGPVSSTPVRSGDVLLVAVEGGPLFLVDPAKGAVGQPFWPKLGAGQFPRWRGPAETAAGQFVVSDGHGKIYKVSVEKDKLTLVAESPLESPLVSPLASAGGLVWGADARGQLVAFGAEDLKATAAVSLDAPVAWGPVRLGELVLVSTATERLIAMAGDPAPKWQVDLPHGPIAGGSAAGGQILFTSGSGFVWGLKADTGENLSAVETGVPLVGVPVVAGDKILVTGREGSVHVLSASPASLFKPKVAENAAASAAP